MGLANWNAVIGHRPSIGQSERRGSPLADGLANQTLTGGFGQPERRPSSLADGFGYLERRGL